MRKLLTVGFLTLLSASSVIASELETLASGYQPRFDYVDGEAMYALDIVNEKIYGSDSVVAGNFLAKNVLSEEEYKIYTLNRLENKISDLNRSLSCIMGNLGLRSLEDRIAQMQASQKEQASKTLEDLRSRGKVIKNEVEEQLKDCYRKHAELSKQIGNIALEKIEKPLSDKVLDWEDKLRYLLYSIEESERETMPHQSQD